VVSITTRPPLPPRKDPVPIVQEAGWALAPVWIGAENLAPPGFDPRTFQPVASRYTDYAIPAPRHNIPTVNIVGIPTCIQHLSTGFVRRPDDGHVRVETCSLTHNKM
jgi:hypothetical protein